MNRFITRTAGIAFVVSSMLAAGAACASSARLTVLDSAASPKQDGNGIDISELSGLAWDADEKLLYAVSDDGILHHFRLQLGADKIEAIEPVFSAKFSTGDTPSLVNAEGLAAVNGDNGRAGDTELVIAFEDGPALYRFTPQGKALEKLALPEPLSDVTKYNADNSRLEAVTFDAERGILTAPEEPMADKPGDTHSIYALDGTSWTFPAFQPKRSDVKAIEPMADGRMLVLERTRQEKGGDPTARLRIVELAGCEAAEPCKPVELDAAASPLLDDNFEGMARVADDLFVAVSDRKKRDDKPTAFVLFSVKPAN